MATKKVRIAIIGCGVIAPLHLSCYQNNRNAKVVATCDIIESRAKALADKAGCDVWTRDAAEIFASPDIDAVDICTDHASHCKLACAALAAGKHVLCEKSLARTAGDLKKMLASAAAHPELVSSGIFQHRFEPIPRALKRLVDQGAFGTLLTATGVHHCLRTKEYFDKDDWRGTVKGEGGSVLINQSIHFFDLLLWIAGGAKTLRGFARNLARPYRPETEDVVSVALEFNNGAIGSFVCTNSSNIGWTYRLALHGTKGAVEYSDNKITLVSFADPKVEARVRKQLESAAALEAELLGKAYYGCGHKAQLDDFVAAIQKGRAPFVSFADAATSDKFVFEAYCVGK